MFPPIGISPDIRYTNRNMIAFTSDHPQIDFKLNGWSPVPHPTLRYVTASFPNLITNSSQTPRLRSTLLSLLVLLYMRRNISWLVEGAETPPECTAIMVLYENEGCHVVGIVWRGVHGNHGAL